MINSHNKNFNSVTNNSLLILQLNANGLKSHAPELEVILNNKRLDIALITETYFTEYTKIFIPGYKLIHTNHPDNTAHGGVAMYIKSNIMFQLLPSFSQDYIQSCTIAIKLNNYYFTIAALYAPPKHNITFSKFSQYFNIIKNNFIIGSDYNAKHQARGCYTNNVLTKIPNHIFCHISDLLDLNSDHSAVLLTLNASPAFQKTPLCLFNRSTIIYNPIPEQIRIKIVEKRKTRAFYQRTRVPSHKQSYNRLSKSLSKLIAKHKNIVFTYNLTNLYIVHSSQIKIYINIFKIAF
ncbi:hypothetical protein AGLY_008623 [Aphis glycines]|uniref:Endonuclease/exonuclease/phosphatase domain-containing protein n=1 Tax=Aphis glycines TaxID=307491 RepID=A0A6G0TMT4_APHGL|nr:hypothetical protein AGLY_008623 [Aphis glycines]